MKKYGIDWNYLYTEYKVLGFSGVLAKILGYEYNRNIIIRNSKNLYDFDNDINKLLKSINDQKSDKVNSRILLGLFNKSNLMNSVVDSGVMISIIDEYESLIRRIVDEEGIDISKYIGVDKHIWSLAQRKQKISRMFDDEDGDSE